MAGSDLRKGMPRGIVHSNMTFLGNTLGQDRDSYSVQSVDVRQELVDPSLYVGLPCARARPFITLVDTEEVNIPPQAKIST